MKCSRGKKVAMPVAGETAKVGEHFLTFKEGKKTNFVCTIFPCLDVFASSTAYHNHALSKHSLFQARVEKKKPDKTNKKDAPKATSGQKRVRSNTGKSKEGETSIFCYDYLRLRGDCPVRWRETKTGKKAGFRKKSERFFEIVYGPEPAKPETNLYIEVLERALPRMGHSNWECLLDDQIYAALHKSMSRSARTNSVFDWCTTVEDSIKPDVPKEESLESQLVWLKSKSFCRALRHIFKKIDWEDEHNRGKAYPVRELFADAAKVWLERTRQRLIWFQNTSEEKIAGRAEAAYVQWKKTNKDQILDTQRQNLFYTLTTHFKRSSEEAIAQALLQEPSLTELMCNDEWIGHAGGANIDTSSDEDKPVPSVPPFKYRYQVREQSQHVDEVQVPVVRMSAEASPETPITPVCAEQMLSDLPGFVDGMVSNIVPDLEESDAEDNAFMPQKVRTNKAPQSQSRLQGNDGSTSQAGPHSTNIFGVMVAHSSASEPHVSIPEGRRKQGKLRRKPVTKQVANVAAPGPAANIQDSIQVVIAAEEDDSPLDFHKTLHVPETLDTPLDLHFMSQFDSIQ